jgi:hypothetical protein
MACFVPIQIRGVCIAVKYAFYGEMDIDEVNSVKYNDKGVRDKKQISNFTVNAAGHQTEALFEELYSACVRKDIDLRAARCSINPSVAVALVDQTESALASCAEELALYKLECVAEELFGDLKPVREQAAKGRLPASVLAFHVVHVCCHMKQAEGMHFMLSNIPAGLVLGVIPLAMRGLQSEPVFGVTPMEQVCTLNPSHFFHLPSFPCSPRP